MEVWVDGRHFCITSIASDTSEESLLLSSSQMQEVRVKEMIAHESNTLPGKMEKEGRFPLEPSYFLNDIHSLAPKRQLNRSCSNAHSA